MAGFICGGCDGASCIVKVNLTACRSRFGKMLLPVVLVFAAQTFEAAESEPHVFSVTPKTLPTVKARLGAGDRPLNKALKTLVSDADKALPVAPLSVMDKPRAGASGDKHDYFSQAPYFWPNPTNAGGLPYVRKDGARNPESYNEFSDAPRLGRLADTVETLALAYYFTGREPYAARATKLLRGWFLDPATRMNPNFNQAQAVPGVNSGRGTGMIESRSLTDVCDAIAMLRGSTNWTHADQDGLETWMRQFLEWAQTSKNGRDEAAAKNNHGSWYDVQIAHLALFLGDTNLARGVIESAREHRIAVQIKPDGSQPLELAREDSFGYSRFNVQALFALATLGDHVGVDLWHFQTADGAGLRQAFDFLLPYAEEPDRPWPYERGKKDSRALGPLLRQACVVYRDERYRKALNKSRDGNTARHLLLMPLD